MLLIIPEVEQAIIFDAEQSHELQIVREAYTQEILVVIGWKISGIKSNLYILEELSQCGATQAQDSGATQEDREKFASRGGAHWLDLWLRQETLLAVLGLF